MHNISIQYGSCYATMPWVDIEEYSQAIKGVSQGGQGALAVMSCGGPTTVMLQEMGRMA